MRRARLAGAPSSSRSPKSNRWDRLGARIRKHREVLPPSPEAPAVEGLPAGIIQVLPPSLETPAEPPRADARSGGTTATSGREITGRDAGGNGGNAASPGTAASEAEPVARTRGPDRVRAALDAASPECAIRTLPESTRTAVEAAAAVGCSVGEIAKSLVFRAGDRAVVAVMSGDHRLDPDKLAAALGEAVGRADADFVRATTGFAIGGVPPLGHATPIDVFMDADLFRFDRIWAAAGSPHSVFSIEPARLRDASGATVMELKAG